MPPPMITVSKRSTAASEMVFRLLPIRSIDAGGSDSLDLSRRLARVVRQSLGGHPLEHVELVIPGLVEDELVDARLDVRPDHVVESLLRGPWIGVRLGHPVVDRPVQRLRVPTDLVTVVIEHLVALAHLLRRAKGIPGVRVPGMP